MKQILLALVGTTALVGLVGTASAADLAVRNKQYYKAPVAAPVVGNWAGLYAGVNGGGGWGSGDWTGLPIDVSGGLFGGTLGYNWQFGTWVLGLEGDADWSNIKGDVTNATTGLTSETRNDFLATIRGRVGYAVGQWLPYVTGGLAIGNIKGSLTGVADVDQTNAGWTAGAGVEVSFAPQWSAKVEYLHVDLGNVNYATPAVNVDFNANIVRGGVNYRF